LDARAGASTLQTEQPDTIRQITADIFERRCSGTSLPFARAIGQGDRVSYDVSDIWSVSRHPTTEFSSFGTATGTRQPGLFRPLPP
jgi:hypothetical protein